MTKPKPHVANYKKEEINRIKNLIQKYKVIAVADMTNMPSPQLQKLRASIKDSVLITMSKGRLIKIAFDEIKDKIRGLDKINSCIRGMPALLLTNSNPFVLSKLLKKSRSSAPAKAGQIAPNDIVVHAGPTAFPPGPIIGELSQAGVKASVVEGKITVKEDTVVVKEGQQITQQVANILTKLGIEPMEIGIHLLAALENGTVFTKDVLSIDEQQYLSNIRLAYQNAFNLAFSIAYPIKENIKLLIKKVYLDSIALSESRDILTSETVKKELAKANLEAESLKSKLNLPEEFFKEEPVENVKKESDSLKSRDDTDEKVAQEVLKKLQDAKIAKQEPMKKPDKKFEKDEKVAQEVLKKLQDQKIEKDEKEARKPRGYI